MPIGTESAALADGQTSSVWTKRTENPDSPTASVQQLVCSNSGKASFSTRRQSPNANCHSWIFPCVAEKNTPVSTPLSPLCSVTLALHVCKRTLTTAWNIHRALSQCSASQAWPFHLRREKNVQDRKYQLSCWDSKEHCEQRILAPRSMQQAPPLWVKK